MSVEVPYPVFTNRDGEPIDNGYVWVGVANINPQINPVQVYFDRDLTQLAAQPLRTINGYVSNAGTPSQIYVDANNFSILVLDKNGTTVYSFADGTGIEPTPNIPNNACGLAYTPNFTGAITRPTCEKLEESVSVKDFGAVGDGGTDDTVAIQAFFNYLANTGGAGYINPGDYLITSGLLLLNPANGFLVFGSGDKSCIKLRSSSNVTALSIVAPTGVVMENFLIDCGFSVTGFASHGYSFSDTNAVTMRNVNVIDHRNAAGLMFLQSATAISTSQNVNGEYRNCYIIDSYSDSKGNGRNGFLLECLFASAIINCHVAPLDRTETPCIGLQLKNECRYSQIIGGSAEGCLAGVGFAGDGAVAGTGAYNCSVNGTIVKDSLDGAIIGKTTDCDVNVIVDMNNNSSNSYGINVAGFNTGLQIKIVVSNIPATKHAVRISSSRTNVDLTVPRAIGSGLLLELTIGVVQTFTRVNYNESIGTSGNTLLSYITDNSGTTTNFISYLPAIVSGGLTNTTSIQFNTIGGGQTFNSYSGTGKSMNWRLDGADQLNLFSGFLSPVTDNAKTLGRAVARWSEVFAGTGTINTSDEREKQDFATLNEAEKRVSVVLKGLIKKYRFKNSVQKKEADARIHIGVVAQEVESAFAAEGLDAKRYGILCYDEWQNEFNEQGDLVTAAGNRYGIRYEELFAFIIGAM